MRQARAFVHHREQSVFGPVAVFAITGLVAVFLLGLGAVSLLRSTATDEAIEDAERVTRLAGDAVVAPMITPGVLRGDPRAIDRLDAVVRRFLIGDRVVRVKLWTADGTIIYSDERRLIGQRYEVAGEELEALEQGTIDAEVSDVSGPENRYEARYRKLLEVYMGLQATDGERVLFESYQRFSSVAASGRRVWQRFLPALIGALVLLELLQIPLAFMLARRLRERQRERSLLLERAVDASAEERRRIAASLHDGPVQELAGVGFSLAAAASRMEGEERVVVEDAAARTRDTMRDLRTMLVELYPATLHRSGLAAAVSDLLSPLRSAGIDAHADIPATLALPAQAEALLFRAAREGLQNVYKHAGASHVDVRVRQEDGRAELIVRDDGKGLTEDREPGLGLRLVSDLAEEAGGTLELTSGNGSGPGTVLRVEVPLA